jgi:hypothetical protein
MYYCINNYESEPKQSLKDFCLEIAKHELDKEKDNFIIDMMHLNAIHEFNKKAQLFIEEYINNLMQELIEEGAGEEEVRSVPYYQ